MRIGRRTIETMFHWDPSIRPLLQTHTIIPSHKRQKVTLLPDSSPHSICLSSLSLSSLYLSHLSLSLSHPSLSHPSLSSLSLYLSLLLLSHPSLSHPSQGESVEPCEPDDQ